jgi:hypothetical protein
MTRNSERWLTIHAFKILNGGGRAGFSRVLFFLAAADPFVDGLLVKPPHPANPYGRNLSFRGILANGNFM